MNLGLPNFLIIGAQKAGSTWIYDRLKEHPQVFVPERVELLHFNRRNCTDSEAIAAYRKHFSNVSPQHVWIGEKTPGYFWSDSSGRFEDQPGPGHNPRIPEDIRTVLGPDVRIVISLRHPVARAISAYAHHGKRRRIAQGETLRDVMGKFGILDIGFYDAHLRAWEKLFPTNHIETIIFEEEILHSPALGLDRLSAFLGIDREGFAEPDGKRSNPGAAMKTVDGRFEFDIADLEPVGREDVQVLLDEYADTLERLHVRFGPRLTVWEDVTSAYRDFVSAADG